jgi:hypothetical protein
MVDQPLVRFDDDVIEAVAEHSAPNLVAELRADTGIVIDQLPRTVRAGRRAQRLHAPDIGVVGDNVPRAIEEQRQTLFLWLARNSG